MTNALIPKKSLGQNFLINIHTQKRIVDACSIKSTDSVVEIGPGKGAITQHLIHQTKALTVIEKDKRLINDLREKFQGTPINIIQGDFLKINLDTLTKDAVIVGNLPYNAATAIIEKILLFNKDKNKFNHCYFMVQMEHGRRICAQPNSKEYGPLSCLVQYFTNPKILFKISRTHFKPQPKVQSCFIHLEIPSRPKYNPQKFDSFIETVYTAFNQRRKTLVNALSARYDKKAMAIALNELHINQKVRAENLTLDNFIDLADKLKS